MALALFRAAPRDVYQPERTSFAHFGKRRKTGSSSIREGRRRVFSYGGVAYYRVRGGGESPLCRRR